MSKFTVLLASLIHGAEHHRAYLYRAFTGLAAAAVAGGLIDGSKVGLAVSIVSAVFGVPSGLASANTSTKKKPKVYSVLSPVQLHEALGEPVAEVVAQTNRPSGVPADLPIDSEGNPIYNTAPAD